MSLIRTSVAGKPSCDLQTAFQLDGRHTGNWLTQLHLANVDMRLADPVVVTLEASVAFPPGSTDTATSSLVDSFVKDLKRWQVKRK